MISRFSYQFLALNQPLVDLIEVENMMARQHPHFIAFDELGQTYRTFNLCFEPGLCCRSMRSRPVILVLSRVVVRVIITKGFKSRDVLLDLGVRGWGDEGSYRYIFPTLVFFPACSSPYAPWKISDDVFWGAVELGGASGSDAVD
jgi:hypothetical protein